LHVQKHTIADNIMEKINSAIAQGYYLVEVDIPITVQQKIFEMFKKRNYMIMKDNSNDPVIQEYIKEQERSQKKDTSRTNFSYSVPHQTKYNPKERFFVVWAGSNKFCKTVSDRSFNNLSDRGEIVMDYVGEMTSIKPIYQEWIYPKSNDNILNDIGSIAKNYK